MHGLYLLWWVQDRHLPAALVAAILAAGDLAIMALEIPTGWLADRFGHRASLIFGSAAQTLGMLACWLADGAFGVSLAVILVGVGDACRSGANHALLYRTCVALDRESSFQRLEARTRAVSLVALVALVLAGGVIVERWGFASGWATEAMLCAIGLAIAIAFVEPPAAPPAEEETSALTGGDSGVRVLAGLIVPGSVLGGAAAAALFVAQTGAHIEPRHATVLVAAVTLVEAAGSALASRLPPTGVRAQIALTVVGGLLIAMGVAREDSLLFVTVLLSFLVGVAVPLRAAAIQRLASDAIRARVASVASACDMALSTLTLPFAGMWSSRRH